ncbi:MAG: chemotaxis protein R [Bacteroidia bacterium]|nr:MAG: chemotaxis protein R [Bacteroidia bacterium]
MFNRPDEEIIQIEPEEITKLTDAIFTKYGYDFSNYAISSFKRRILMVLKKYGLKSVDKLIQKILFEPAFFEQFVLDITVNTTEMFRDPTFYKALKQQVVPLLATKPEFNVWHAACSTGEEVISLAILLDQEGILHKAKIYATDINHVVLQKAASAAFPVRNLDFYHENYAKTEFPGQLSDYYTIENGMMQFDKRLIQNVKFKHHDLARDVHFYKFDLILCRNVMIYFNQTLQNRVFELLHNSLFMNGFLCLGAKESLIWCKIADKFETVNSHEKIFRKIKS